MKKKLASVILIMAIAGWVLSCGSAEEKMMKFFGKGKALYEQGDLIRARLELRNALQINPKFAQGYYYLGLVERRAKDYQKAFRCFSKAVELDEKLMDAQLELGKLFMGAKVVAKALEKAELVLAAQPENIEAVCLKAAVLLHQGKAVAASELLNEGLNKGIGIGDADVYVLLALAALQQKDPNGVRAAMRKGIAAHPDSVKLYTLKANVEARVGQLGEAEKALRKIIALEPKHLEHRLKLADLLWQTDRKAKARQMVAQMIARDPQSEEGHLQAARFFLSHGKDREAAQLLKEGMAALPNSFKLRFTLSEIYLQEARADAACKVLENCLTMENNAGHPNIVQAKNLLARADLAKGEVAAAESLIDEVIEASPKNVDAHFVKGLLYMMRQQGGDAVAEFRTVVTEKPEFVEGHLRLAEAHLLNKEDSLALDSLLRASNALPGSKTLHRGLAQLYIRQKDYAAAEKQLNLILQTDSQDYGVAASLGDLFAAAGQPERAEAQYRKICEQAPDKELGYLKLSRFYATQSKPHQAAAVLVHALDSNPGSQRLLSALVEVYVRNGQTDRALEVCQGRLDKDPGQAFMYNLMGVVYLLKKDFMRAEQALNKAIELEPLEPVPYGNLAKVYLAQGRTDAAIEKFKAALETNPRNPGAYLALSKLYEQKGAYLDAVEVYEKALNVYPNMWVAANNMAFLMCENAQGPDDLARAAAWGQKAAELHPDDPMVEDTMAWIAFKQGNPDQAQRVMEKAMAKAPEDPALNYHMGAILADSGKVIEARERLTAALANSSRFPGREMAEALLARLSE